VSEIEERLRKCRELMNVRKLTHLIVYGDREHFANLMYLTHFDPKFEEALLIINHDQNPLILVGQECIYKLILFHVPGSFLRQKWKRVL
jgi:hypothetical protein